MEIVKRTSDGLVRTLESDKVGVILDKEPESKAYYWDYIPLNDGTKELILGEPVCGPRVYVPVFPLSKEKQTCFETLFPHYIKVLVTDGDYEGFVGYYKVRF